MPLITLHILYTQSLSDCFFYDFKVGSVLCLLSVITHGETMWMRSLGKIKASSVITQPAPPPPFHLIAHGLELFCPGREKKEQSSSVTPREFFPIRIDLRPNGLGGWRAPNMFPFVFSGPPSSRPSHCQFPPNILTSIRWGGGQGQQQQNHQLSLSASTPSLRQAFLVEHFSGLTVVSLLSDMILGKTELNKVCLCISLRTFALLWRAQLQLSSVNCE